VGVKPCAGARFESHRKGNIMKKSLSFALTANALLGCGSVTPTEDPVGVATEPIWNGVADTGADQRFRDRIVRLRTENLPPSGSPPGTPNTEGGCTATFITHDAVLTASHCILALNLPGNVRGLPVSAFVNAGQDANQPKFTRQMTSYNARLQSGNVFDLTDNRNNDVAVIFLETAEAALARLPNGPDTMAGTEDDPVGPDGVLGTADDVDAYLPLPTRPYASTPLPATGTLVAEIAGYGRIQGEESPNGLRIRNSFNPFGYNRFFAGPSAGPDLNGDNVIDPFVTHRIQTSWLSTEPAMGDGIPGSADDIIPIFAGPDNGDSGGPLLMWNASRNVYEQIGVASTSCTPLDMRDADNVPNNGNESLNCSPVQCPAGQYWTNANVCAAIPAAPPGAPAITTQTLRWSGHWADLTTRNQTLGSCTTSANCPAEATCTAGRCVVQGNQEWLASAAGDPTRPNRWVGDRDYVGSCRNAGADANCDRFFDDQGTEKCPNFFDAEAGFAPELRTNPPVIYGAEGVDLHDRVEVWASADPQNPTLGGVAAGKGIVYVRNDVRLGRIWGGDHLQVHWRSAWTSAVMNTPSTYNFIGTYPASAVPVTGALVPSIRYTARPTNLAAGPGFPRANVNVNPPTPLPTTMSPLQNCTSTTPPTVLDPGSYINDLTINGTCRVALRSGKYYFDKLKVEPEAQLRIDHTGGVVEIFVKDFMHLKGNIVNTGGRASAHVISVFGDGYTFIQSSSGFLGTLVVPNGVIDLNSRTHQGAFYGHRVVVHQDADVRFAPCSASLEGTAGN
jgi:hypothetical protein